MLFSCELSYSRKQPGFSTTDRSMSSEIKQPSRSKASWLASSLSSPEVEPIILQQTEGKILLKLDEVPTLEQTTKGLAWPFL
uniref:Uncharacterized protein n=1 Tax=Oryza meridionalis TaxID=40149 RepID=A0A0E0EJ20_9ORYZ